MNNDINTAISPQIISHFIQSNARKNGGLPLVGEMGEMVITKNIWIKYLNQSIRSSHWKVSVFSLHPFHPMSGMTRPVCIRCREMIDVVGWEVMQ